MRLLLLPIVVLLPALLVSHQAGAQSNDVAVIARAKDIISSLMKDPNSSQFKDIGSFKTFGPLPVVCGSVNAKNSYGGYVGFRRFVVADRMPFVRDAEHTAEQKAFDDVWNHFCAADDSKGQARPEAAMTADVPAP